MPTDPRAATLLTLLIPLAACRPNAPTKPAAFDVQAHRGDRGEVPPGNTLASFQSALALGVDTLEADMQISADQVVVMGPRRRPARDRLRLGGAGQRAVLADL